MKEYGKFLNPKEIRSYPSEKQEELELLGARLEQLKSLHHQETCRQGVASSTFIKQSIKGILTILKKQLKQVEDAILKIIESDSHLKEKYELLQSMKGVGKVISNDLNDKPS